jgi:Rrf2 family protein
MVPAKAVKLGDTMKLSTRSRYGTRLLIDIASNGNGSPVPVSEISRRIGVSVKYLEQLIRPLKKAQYLNSVRGPKGGHVLARRPEDITVGEVVRLLEGGISLTDCIEHPEICPHSDSCNIRGVWTTATDSMLGILDSITVQDLKQEACHVK